MKDLCYDTYFASKIYTAAMLLNRYEWLMRTITFHDHKTVRTDKFARMMWFVTEFEKNARKYYSNARKYYSNVRKYYHYTDFAVID